MINSTNTQPGRKLAGGILLLGTSRLIKSALVIASLALIGRNFGAGIPTDTFLMAQMWPILIATFTRVVISVSFIPTFVDIAHNETEESTWRFASNTFNLLALASVAGAILYFGLAAGIFKILTFFDVSQIDRIGPEFLFLTLLFLPVIFLSPMFAFWESILFTKKDYRVVSVANLFVGICEIGAVLLFSDRYGFKAIAIGISIGYLLQLLIVLPKFRSKIKYFRFATSLRYPGTGRFFSLVGPVVYGAALSQIVIAVDWVLASLLGEGRVTSLVFGWKLGAFIPSFFAVSAVIPMLGSFSEFIVQKDYDKLKGLMLRVIRFVFLTIIPFCVWFAVMRGPLADVLFRRGKFSAEALQMVKSLLFFLIPVILFQCILPIFRQILLAMRRTRFITLEVTSVLVVKVGLSIVLVRYLDVAGLALATAISSAWDLGLLVTYFRKRTGPFPKSGSTSFLCRILLASAIMGAVLWWVGAPFGESISTKSNLQQIGYLASSALGGAVLYLILAGLFGVLRLKDPLGWKS